MGHTQFANEPYTEEDHSADSGGHGFGATAQSRHIRMAAAIADCDVLLVRGMGAGAYQSMEQAGIRPIVTDITTIDEAVQAVINDNISDHTELLH